MKGYCGEGEGTGKRDGRERRDRRWIDWFVEENRSRWDPHEESDFVNVRGE